MATVAMSLAEQIENVLINGNLKAMNAEQRMSYYKQVCESLGLNPLTRPFEYIELQGKMVLYAKRDATEQLRKIHKVSITSLTSQQIQDVYVVTALAQDHTGRTDSSTGAVAIGGAKGEQLANMLMKAETKAKRRVTLSICGLGMLDETEVETVPGAMPSKPELIPAKRKSESPALPPKAEIPGFTSAADGLKDIAKQLESGTHPDQQPVKQNPKLITLAQRKRFFAIWKQHGWSEEQVRDILKQDYGLLSTADIPKDRYDFICKRFEVEYQEPAFDDPFADHDAEING